jgi:hypothetical protein
LAASWVVPGVPAAEADRSPSEVDAVAVHALQGVLAGKLAVPNAVLDPADAACLAYDYAAALLRERARRSPPPPAPAPAPVGPPPRFPRPTAEQDEMPF